MSYQCKAHVQSTWDRCTKRVVAGSDFCAVHDPELREQRRRKRAAARDGERERRSEGPGGPSEGKPTPAAPAAGDGVSTTEETEKL